MTENYESGNGASEGQNADNSKSRGHGEDGSGGEEEGGFVGEIIEEVEGGKEEEESEPQDTEKMADDEFVSEKQSDIDFHVGGEN